jgi:hypothetical protein
MSNATAGDLALEADVGEGRVRVELPEHGPEQ